jgi:hypothetical protein
MLWNCHAVAFMSDKKHSIDWILSAVIAGSIIVWIMSRFYIRGESYCGSLPFLYFFIACGITLVAAIVLKFGMSSYFSKHKNRSTLVIAAIFFFCQAIFQYAEFLLMKSTPC